MHSHIRRLKERARRTVRRTLRTIVGESPETLASGQGERQAAPTLEGIRADHVARYAFACRYVACGASVLDVASGVGYGSYLIVSRTKPKIVVAIDRSAQAVNYALAHYRCASLAFLRADCCALPVAPNRFDLIVSLETIEHIPNADEFLKGLFSCLKPGGRVIASSPNEEVMPFRPDRYPFHIRHYRIDQITALLKATGFAVEGAFCQETEHSREVQGGVNGKYLIIVAKKPTVNQS